MDTSFRRSLTISAALHAALFLSALLQIALKPKYVIIPVDLMYFAPPAQRVEEIIKKEDEIIVPRKPAEVKKKSAEVKKDKPQPILPPPPAPPAPMKPSASISPETAQFPYLYYLRRVRETISSNWGWSGRETGGLKSVVYFKIRRDGTIIEPELKESSSDDVFDAVALRAVKISAPFAPLPTGYQENTLGIYFEFSYKE